MRSIRTFFDAWRILIVNIEANSNQRSKKKTLSAVVRTMVAKSSPK